MNEVNKNMWYKILHEFRNWNREWDLHIRKNPVNADEFVQYLSDRYSVVFKQNKND